MGRMAGVDWLAFHYCDPDAFVVALLGTLLPALTSTLTPTDRPDGSP
jgi:hypothetical protein